MIQPYSEALLKQHFPSFRDPPPDGVFELAIACCGGTATGPYVAGVLDFLWEAFEEWRAAARAGQAPNHQVRLTHLVGTSAGGLSSGLAALATIKVFPHVYHDSLWLQYRAANPTLPAVQPKTENPHYNAWVKLITLDGPDGLLSHPQEVESGQIYLFHSAPATICKIVLTAAEPAPAANGRDWVNDPLEVRGTIGNLQGVPYALSFDSLNALGQTDEFFEAHRDNVGFAVVTGHVGGVSTGIGGAPDCHVLTQGIFDAPPPAAPPEVAAARIMFDATMIATSAIPLVFQVTEVPQNPVVYQWRTAYWDVARQVAVADMPAFPSPPANPINYAATDGGLFDNRPFNLAHQRLVGPRGRNPQDGVQAARAVILVDPLAEDREPIPANPDATKIVEVITKMVLTPILQDRLDTMDLAQFKDESIYSRFMISPSRPNPVTNTSWAPSKALLSAPMNAFLGFAAEAYREHDFLVGRRNAQQFLRRTFAVPKDNVAVKAATGWTAADEFVDSGVTYRVLVPLRGRAADEQPLPDWAWQALTDDAIQGDTNLVRDRANAIFHNLKNTMAGAGRMGMAARAALDGLWALWGRGAVMNAFKSAMTDARDGLDPRAPDR
jgi:hypothetical protein